MRVKVFDSSAAIAFLRGEAGSDVVASLCADEENNRFMHALNYCEMYYDCLRRGDAEIAQGSVNDMQNILGIQMRSDITRNFWMQAGRLKALGRISLADCFCITLAIHLKGEVVTADHHEMDRIQDMGVVPILFIR